MTTQQKWLWPGIQQSQTTDQPMASRGRGREHQQTRDSSKNTVKHNRNCLGQFREILELWLWTFPNELNIQLSLHQRNKD